MKQFSFEKLIVWQKARTLSVLIYKATTLFPVEERFGLTSQMRRCAISIASNIAEGSGRHTNKDKARFTEIAFGSALELLNQLILSKERDYITNENYIQIKENIRELAVMLDALRNSQLNK